MPSEVTEDTIQLSIGLIEAETLRVEGGPTHRQSYPYPLLKPTAQRELREFRSVVLENAYIRVTVVPDLGGRIVKFLDKRTGVELFPDNEVRAREGGPRGVFVEQGMTLRLEEGPRLNDLGMVRHLIEPGDEGEEPPSLWLQEIAGNGLGWHMRMWLPEDRAELAIEVRVHNRTLRSVRCSPGIHFALAGEPRDWSGGHVIYNADLDGGFCFEYDRDLFTGLIRGLPNGVLAPRQLDAWSVRVRPLTKFGGSPEVSSDLAAHLDLNSLRIQSATARPQHRVQLLLEDGQTLEAPADLYPEHMFEVSMETMPAPPQALAVVSPGREVVFKLERGGSAKIASPERFSGTEPNWVHEETSDASLKQATADVAQRHLAHVLLAHRAIARGDYDGSNRQLEQALLFNAEDHLTWWLKAVVTRLSGDLAEERPELLNAHFLAPLEPALRAESFLAQGVPEGKEPSFVVRPLQETPEAFIEVAHLLIEAGLYAEAASWLDESVRHADLPMLRYMWAYLQVTQHGLEFEAAQHIGAAAKRPVGPPYPWRPWELKVLRTLAEKFPGDEHLREYLALAETYAIDLVAG